MRLFFIKTAFNIRSVKNFMSNVTAGLAEELVIYTLDRAVFM